jgi:tetratricopeptide (TPR) repeat protein
MLKKPLFYNPIVHISLIILLGLIAYSNTSHSPFVFDDTPNIVENHRIKDLSNIPSSFIHIGDAPISARPLTAATFAINYYLGGLNTTGYHIVNLFLHIANGILLYFLIKITAGYLNYIDKKKTVLVTLFSSIIFIVHPIQTESVTYIVSRSVLLSTFFFFLGIILFTKAAGTEGKRKLFYTIFLIIVSLLGMTSREEFFIFPVMLILYDLYFISKQNIKEVLRNYKIHLSVISTMGYVLYIVLSFNYSESAGFNVKVLTPLEYLMTQFNVHWTYIRLLFLPINQNLDYDYPIARTLFELPTFISFIGYIGLWGTGIYLYRKKPVISFCIFWFVITLFPTSGFMPIIDVIFEHRLYMPSVGIFIALIAAIWAVMARWVTRVAYANKDFVYIMFLVVIVLSVASYVRNRVWGDEITLWSDVVQKSPSKMRGYNELGNAFLKRGAFNQALQSIRVALKLAPLDPDLYYNLGTIYGKLSLTDEAIANYFIVIELDPSFIKAHYNLGLIYLGRNDLLNAYREFETVSMLDPSDYQALQFLAYIRSMRDKAD